MLTGIVVASIVVLVLGYRIYGRYLARMVGLDDRRPTPAVALADGVDFVEGRFAVVFGHHFSSIAGAGPIVGPVLAAMLFGWGPTWGWILLGSIFVGGVHDFGSLLMSVRNEGKSVSAVAEKLVGKRTAWLFALFLLFALIYVIIVFLDLTAVTFSQTPAVATASGWFVVMAVVFGYMQLRRGLPVLTASLIFVPLCFAGLAVGHFFPAPELVKEFWVVVILAYCLVAAILPVNVLLQPRDYLSAFFLIGMLGLGLTGLLAAGASIEGTFYKGFSNPAASPAYLFPALFITVACGACSGFHSVVASGTTSKQVCRETDVLRVGYGGMLVEGLLAVFAMATVMVLADPILEGKAPPAIFATGAAVFMGALGIPEQLGMEFTALVVSTFLLTTLDTCTRLSRFLLAELAGWGPGRHRFLGTVLVLIPPAIFGFLEFGGVPAWRAIWPLFGSTNQLIGALALVTLFVYLRREGLNGWVAFFPMVFMVATPMLALGFMVVDGGAEIVLRGLAGMMFLLGVVVTFVSLRSAFADSRRE